MVSFSSTHNRHIPVMLMETINNLRIKDNGIYVDGTLGLGGHSKAILQKIDTGLFDPLSYTIKKFSKVNFYLTDVMLGFFDYLFSRTNIFSCDSDF